MPSRHLSWVLLSALLFLFGTQSAWGETAEAERHAIAWLESLPSLVLTEENKGREAQGVARLMMQQGQDPTWLGIMGTTIFLIRADTWKKRWNTDTEQQSMELKRLSSQLADATVARVRAENLLQKMDEFFRVLQVEIKVLLKRIAELEALPPPAPSP